MDTIAGMRIFARVVEAGSFSAAARQLGASPSSVSRQINDLEDELGARLFHRTTRKLSLTEAGRLYHERAARILIDVDEARLAVSQIGAAPSGILRVTVAESVASRHIVPMVATFQERFPAVQVALSVTDRLVDLVEEGFDLAIRVGRPRDSSLVARKIGSGRRIVCAGRAYLKKAGRPKEPADLVNHNCVTFRQHPGSNVWSFRVGRSTLNIRVTGSVFADSGECLVAAAVAGIGIILVPAWLIGTDLKRGRLLQVLPEFEVVPKDSPLYALYPHQRHLPPKVRAFIDFLVARFAGEESWDGSTKYEKQV
ncbi:MAG: LysR family transcriptional regulator [Acidiferrobacterales bacterium]